MMYSRQQQLTKDKNAAQNDIMPTLDNCIAVSTHITQFTLVPGGINAWGGAFALHYVVVFETVLMYQYLISNAS